MPAHSPNILCLRIWRLPGTCPLRLNESTCHAKGCAGLKTWLLTLINVVVSDRPCATGESSKHCSATVYRAEVTRCVHSRPGWVQESEIAGNSEVRACECPDPGEKEQEAAEAEQADEEPHDQSCTDIAAAAAPEQEGGCCFRNFMLPPTACAHETHICKAWHLN